MDLEKLARLREERAGIYESMRSVLDDAGDEGMTAEQAQEYKRAEERYDAVDNTISAAERQAARDRAVSPESRERSDDPERAAAVASETRAERFEHALGLAEKSDANLRDFLGSEEYREAFADGALRRGLIGATMAPEYRAALNLGLDAEGGYTAPVEFVQELISEAADTSDLRQFARIITTSHGRDMEFPVLATKGSASWTTEVPADPDALKSEPTFGAPKTLEAHPLQREVVTSKDLLQDSALNIEALIRELILESGAELEAEGFITGDGSGKPTGIIPGLDAANVVTGAAGQVDTVTTDELIDVQHAIKARYRANARWRLNDSSLKVIRKLTDNDGQYIWKPGLTEGIPGTILGAPYSVDEFMPDMAASATPILWGDHSGYWVRDVLSLTITRLVEAYARTRQVGFLADGRVDGKLIRPERMAAYENAAA